MKKLLTFLPLIIIALSLASCGIDAKQLNSEIVSLEKELIQKDEKVINLINHCYSKGEQNGLDDEYIDFVDYINESIEEIEKKEEDKAGFKNATQDLFTLYKKVVESDYSKMIDFAKKPADYFTDSDEEEYTKLLQESQNKLIKGVQDFLEAQKKFAEAYGFELVPN